MRFHRLPSGLIVNLSSVRRISPATQDEQSGVTVFFSEGDFVHLDEADARALRKATGTVGQFFKILLFWIVIACAVFLVYQAVRAGR